jgi:hypothetical protein
MIFPQMRDDFGIAVGDEPVSSLFQLFSPLDVIEQFAVEDYEGAAVFVGDGLLAVGEADNA